MAPASLWDVSYADDLPVMLWRARPDMSCEYANRAWREYTGYSAEEAAAQGCSSVVHPEDIARWLDTCVRAYDARAPYEIEYRMRRHDGVYRWVLERGAPREAHGALAGYVGICIDIEERKRAAQATERALERERRLRAATEEASRAKDRLFGNVLAALKPRDPAISSLLEVARTAGENAPAELDAPLLSGVRVLVVEDDPQARELLMKVLRLAGAEAYAVANSAQALPALEDWHPDVLLADSGLPGDDGYVLLRARPAAHRAIAAGYDAQLAKPVEPVALLATVARLVHPTTT
jgi:PAS domain S-box-containing protein